MNNLLLKLFGGAVLVISLGLGWFWQSINQFKHSSINPAVNQKVFVITPGMSTATVANTLERQGIIESAFRFRWLMKFEGKEKQLQAGEYELNAQMSVMDLAHLFVQGKVKQYAFTIVEGWTFRQLLAELWKLPMIQTSLKGKTDAEIMRLLGASGVHPEGQFLPDTYHFPMNTTDLVFLQRAHDAMQEMLDSEWPLRATGLPYQSEYEALIMASIVEKETGVDNERVKIAGVFVRRLQKNMRLQTDPTVIYGMGDQYQGNLRKKDLLTDSPYNTYRRKGLPPTPIALPGRDAIMAALHPEESNDLYFVAKGDGSHYFSATVEEHNNAVKKYQIRQRKKDYRSSPGEKGNDS